MIGLILALALQVDSPSPSPSAAPSPTPRPAPTARPLPKPTPPYLIGPKGWRRIAYPPNVQNYYVNVAGWTTNGPRGEENLIVRTSYSTGLTAQGLAGRRAREVMAGGVTVLGDRSRVLCGGTVTGWELDTEFENPYYPKKYETLYVASPTISFSAEYERPGGAAPAPDAERALGSFCPTRSSRLASARTRAAITLPSSWIASDVSLSFHRAPGSATVYDGPEAQGSAQRILVTRNPTPGGVDPDVDHDLMYAVDHYAKYPHSFDSKRAIELCNGDGWMVVVRWKYPRGDVLDTMVFSFGAPFTYTAVYRRPAIEPANPVAIKALSTLCPPT